MTRIIGKYADEKTNTSENSATKAELRALAVKCQRDNFNYCEPLENYTELAIRALTTDNTISFAYNKVLNERYSEKYESAKELYISTEYEGSENVDA